MTQEISILHNPLIFVVDDHPLILGGIVDVIHQNYPDCEVITLKSAQEILDKVEQLQPNLLIIDLSIPEQLGGTAQPEIGLKLLQKLMRLYPTLNFVVQSSYVKTLIRIKQDIDIYQGGFAIADKTLSTQDLLNRIHTALIGSTHTKDLKIGIELKPEWLEVLQLAFKEGLQDKAIAQRMNVTERSVRHYWTKIYDVLEIYPEDCKQEAENLRIKTEIKARDKGLID
jgi:DNA-binding NarL/FixJ family response regulator